ncbi:MAG: hypothetical protein LBR22_10270 [Desulfovibrio sp.]|jgi:hypothetical protein|nr:hypothetical protein [Desulfovibrio sp.]
MTSDEESKIVAYLQKKTPDQLLSFIMEMCKKDDKLAKKLLDEARLKNDIDAIAQRLCDGVKRMCENLETADPKFDKIYSELLKLLEDGEGDAILKVCDVILKYSFMLIYDYDFADSILEDLVDCIELIPEALDVSSMSHAERLIFCIECEMRAPGATCSIFWLYTEENGTEDDWNIVADALLARLEEGDSYARRLLSGHPGHTGHADVLDKLKFWVGDALFVAHRDEEAKAHGYWKMN